MRIFIIVFKNSSIFMIYELKRYMLLNKIENIQLTDMNFIIQSYYSNKTTMSIHVYLYVYPFQN